MGGRTELAKDDDGLNSPLSTGGPGPPALIKGLDGVIEGQRELWMRGLVIKEEGMW